MSRPPLDEVKHALLKNRAGQPLAAAHAELTRAVGLLLLEVIDRLDRLEQNSGGQ